MDHIVSCKNCQRAEKTIFSRLEKCVATCQLNLCALCLSKKLSTGNSRNIYIYIYIACCPSCFSEVSANDMQRIRSSQEGVPSPPNLAPKTQQLGVPPMPVQGGGGMHPGPANANVLAQSVQPYNAQLQPREFIPKPNPNLVGGPGTGIVPNMGGWPPGYSPPSQIPPVVQPPNYSPPNMTGGRGPVVAPNPYQGAQPAYAPIPVVRPHPIAQPVAQPPRAQHLRACVFHKGMYDLDKTRSLNCNCDACEPCLKQYIYIYIYIYYH